MHSTKALLQVTVEDFEVVCKGLYRALCIREKYMQKSVQRFPRTPSQYLRAIEGDVWRATDAGPGTFRHLQGFALLLQPGTARCQKGVVKCSKGRLLTQAAASVSQCWGYSCPVLGVEEHGRLVGFWLAACAPWYSPLGPVFTPPLKDGQDPFETGNLAEDLGYHLEMKDGVVYIYGDKAAVGRKEPKDLPYPCLEHFVDDMNFLLALIAQGPV